MISTRFAGLDGVSLEAAKLAPVIEEAGHSIRWFAGELGPEFSPGTEVREAHFAAEANLALEARAFASSVPNRELMGEIRWRASALKPAIKVFLETIDVAYIHNALSIPMQLPLAVALTESLAESGTRAVAHHHDFGWEKPRFSECAVPDIVERYFPPVAAGITHCVINSLAGDDLRERTGIVATLLPNILDFARGPQRPVDGSAFREAAGIATDATLLLQPTRIIRRKGIEHTIHLAAGLGPQATVAYSHAADRDEDYWEELQRLAAELGVTTVYSPVGPEDHTDGPWLGDAFAAADLVCFPSIQEGFGNALVEALFFRRPLFVNRYAVYTADIAPLGVQAVEMDHEVTSEVVSGVEELINSPGSTAAMVEANYQIGREHMSHEVIRQRLLPLLDGQS